MNKDWLKIWQWLGFAVTACGGTILHFLYDWLDGAAWVAPFSGVNESTWEHMKLLFWPMFLFAVVEWLFFREEKAFWCIKLRGIVLGLALIPVLFYTYNGVIGKSPDWINIAIFFISAAIAYLWETKQFAKENSPCLYPKAGRKAEAKQEADAVSKSSRDVLWGKAGDAQASARIRKKAALLSEDRLQRLCLDCG